SRVRPRKARRRARSGRGCFQEARPQRAACGRIRRARAPGALPPGAARSHAPWNAVRTPGSSSASESDRLTPPPIDAVSRRPRMGSRHAARARLGPGWGPHDSSRGPRHARLPSQPAALPRVSAMHCPSRSDSPSALLLLALLLAPSVTLVPAQVVPELEIPTLLNEVVVYGREDSLIGEADSPAEGQFGAAELDTRPFLRRGELLEVVPGLIVTQHSGDGKANQYFLRGFNLDHGTDLAISIEDMPVNMRTHAHGQGYADLNFLIPELIGSVNIRKGPYFADEGDFSSVGSVHVGLLDSVNKTMASITAGSFGYRRILGISSAKLGEGTLLIAGEANTYSGPWDNPDNLRKLNSVVRYSQGTPTDGFSLTGMAYANKWNSTDQIPSRAIASGKIGLYGALDPSDGGNSNR